MSRIRSLSPNSNNDSTCRDDWTLTEKKALIEAIKSYGFDNISKLAEVVQTKSIGEVELFMNKRKARAKRLCAAQSGPEAASSSVNPRNPKNVLENLDKLSSLEIWDFFTKKIANPKYKKMDYAGIFADIFRSAANDEKRMEPISGEPNFKAIYNYIASLLSGSMIPPELSGIDSTIIYKIFSDIHSFLDQSDLKEEKDFLEHICDAPKFVRLESTPVETCASSSSTSESVTFKHVDGKDEVSVSNELYDYLSCHKKIQENLNPLCIPVKLLEKEQLEYENYCDETGLSVVKYVNNTN